MTESIPIGDLVLQSLVIFGLAAVVAFAVAGAIRLVVLVISGAEARLAPDAPKGAAAPSAMASAPADIPAAHVAAIAGAVAALSPGMRLVRIRDRRHQGIWAAEGKFMQQTTHNPRHRPDRNRRGPKGQ